MSLFKYLRSLTSAVCLVTLLASCSADNSDKGLNQSGYHLEVVDSISFNRLSRVKLEDYHAENEELLMMDWQTREMLIVDKEGKVISTFQPHKEGPGYVGDFDNGWTFYGKNELIAYGNTYFHVLNQQGERKRRIPYPVETTSTWSLSYDPKMIHTYEQGSGQNVLAILPGAAGPDYGTQAYHDSLQQLVTMDFEKDTHHILSGKPAQSIYRTMGRQLGRGWPYMAQLKGSLFANVYKLDSKLYIRDVSRDSLVSVIDLPEEHHPEFTAISYGAKKPIEQTRINMNIYATGEHVVVRSVGQIPQEVMRGIEQIPDWRESPEFEAAQRQFNYRNFLLFDQEQYLGILDWNIGATQGSVISTETEFLWQQRRYDDERDYHTFLKLKIVKDE